MVSMGSLDFACTCGEDNKRQVRRVRRWAFRYLGKGVTPANLLSRIVYAKEQFHTWIQCDLVEDGMVFTLRAFYEKFHEAG